MKATMRTIIFLLTASFTIIACAAASSTYQLSYDGIVSPSIVTHHASNPQNQNPQDLPNSQLVPPTIAEETISELGSTFVQLWINYDKYLQQQEEDEKQVTGDLKRSIPIDFHCAARSGYEGYIGGTKCSMEYATPDLSFDATLTLSSAPGPYNDYFPTTTTQEEEEEINDNYDSLRVPVAIKVDITMTSTTPLFARDALVESIPIIGTSVGTVMKPSPVWTVQERPSPIQYWARLNEANTKPLQYNDDNEEEDVETLSTESVPLNNPASIETMILSNPSISYRSPIISSSAKIHQSPINTSTSTTAASTNTDIWLYKEAGITNPTKSLFYDSTLRATTSHVGQAHAESFILPAIIANGGPTNILIFSETPMAYIQQVLKYKYMEYLAVVGVDVDALELTKTYMKELDDCEDLVDDGVCSEDERVHIVEENINDWLDMSAELAKTSYNETYDVIYLDIPASPQNPKQIEWLSNEFHEKLQKLMNEETVVVVNAGTSPELNVDFDIVKSSNLVRDKFLDWAFISKKNGGFGYGVGTIYDEVSRLYFFVD